MSLSIKEHYPSEVTEGHVDACSWELMQSFSRLFSFKTALGSNIGFLWKVREIMGFGFSVSNDNFLNY